MAKAKKPVPIADTAKCQQALGIGIGLLVWAKRLDGTPRQWVLHQFARWCAHMQEFLMFPGTADATSLLACVGMLTDLSEATNRHLDALLAFLKTWLATPNLDIYEVLRIESQMCGQEGFTTWSHSGVLPPYKLQEPKNPNG